MMLKPTVICPHSEHNGPSVLLILDLEQGSEVL